MRVLLVDTLSSTNDYAVELVRALERRVELTVFTVEGSRLESPSRIRLLQCFPTHSQSERKVVKLIKEIRACAQLAVEIIRHRRSAVHVQFFRYTFFEAPVYIALRMIAPNLVFTAHNVLPHESRWWHWAFYWVWYRVVRRIHVLSRYAKERLIREFGLPASKIVEIRHGNYRRFRQQYRDALEKTGKAELGLPEDAFVVLLFGAVRQYKGADRALNMLQAIPVTSRTYLVVAGSAEQGIRRELTELAERLGVARRVKWIFRYLPQEEMAKYIGIADVTLFPYTHIYQSGALILAMTCGKAVIASAIEGFREYVEDRVTGILCDTTDAQLLAREILRLESDRELRMSLGDAAGAFAMDRLDWDRIAGEFVAFYEESVPGT